MMPATLFRSQRPDHSTCWSICLSPRSVLRTSGDGIIAYMDVWLQTEGTAKGEVFSYRFVRSPQQATPMTQNSAREAVRGAKRVYPDYSWEMESGFKSGEFVVHGHKKSK